MGLRHVELLPPLEKRKILIHQSWSALLPFVRARLAQHEIYSSQITGTTPFAERVQRIAKFRLDEDHPSTPTAWLLPQERRVVHHLDEPSRVMFITDVGAAGLNLFRASVLIMLDPVWSEEFQGQIIGRAHRQGQKRQVFVYQIIVKDTTDDWMLQLAEGRRDTAQLMRDGDSTLSTDATDAPTTSRSDSTLTIPAQESQHSLPRAPLQPRCL